MEAAKLTLPPNFDKYNKIIEYFRNNGLDCLSSLQEQFRFFVRYICIIPHINFKRQLDLFTLLNFKSSHWWGCWNNPDIDSCDYINIRELRFDISSYNVSKIDQSFLYKHLHFVDDRKILAYFNELSNYGKLQDIYVGNYVYIGNKFNDAVIKITKENFYKYCGYSALIKEYKMKNFVIDVEFNENVAKDISEMINDQLQLTMDNVEEFEQKIAVIDYLQISYKY